MCVVLVFGLRVLGIVGWVVGWLGKCVNCEVTWLLVWGAFRWALVCLRVCCWGLVDYCICWFNCGLGFSCDLGLFSWAFKWWFL